MHNIVTAGRLTPSQMEANARLLDEATSYTAYSYWIPPSEWLYQSGTVVLVAPTATNPPYWQFYEGVAGRLGTYIRRHKEWRDGYFIGNIHWTSVAAKNVDVNWQLSINPVSLTPSTATLPVSSPVGFPCTATSTTTIMINEASSVTLNSSSQVTAKHSGIFVTFGKVANHVTDTSTADREFYGLELIYCERRKQSGSYK